MSKVYWIRGPQGTRGPFDQDQIRHLVTLGQFTPSMEISVDNVTWYSAKKIRGLFPADTTQTDTNNIEGAQSQSPPSSSPSLSSPQHKRVSHTSVTSTGNPVESSLVTRGSAASLATLTSEEAGEIRARSQKKPVRRTADSTSKATSRKKWIWAISVLVLLICGYAVASPFITVMQIRSAIKNQDSQELSEHVDFATLRQNLKEQLNAQIMRETVTELKDNPFSALGAALASRMVDSMIESFVTPSGLANLMKGKKCALRIMMFLRSKEK